MKNPQYYFMKKIFCFTVCILIVWADGLGQTPVAGINDYSLEKKRLYVQICGLYLYASNQGLIDLDSAMSLACRAQHLSPSLAYDEGYNDGRMLPGKWLIDNHQLSQAVTLLDKLKDKEHTLLLLQLGSYYLFKPGANSTDLGGALYFLQKAEQESKLIQDDMLHMETLAMLGRYYAQAGNYRESKKLLSGVVESYRNKGKPSQIAQALNNLATNLPFSDTTKLATFEKCVAIYKKLGNKEKQIELVHKIVDIHFRSGKVEQAITLLQQALAWQQEIGFRHTHYTHTVLVFLYYADGDYKRILFHSESAVNVMVATGDTTFSGPVYLRLGGAYSLVNRIDEAVVAYQKAMKAEHSNSLYLYKSFAEGAEMLAIAGRPEEAVDILNDLITKSPPQALYDKMITERILGFSYLKLNQFSKAETHYLKALKVGDSIDIPAMKKDVAATYSLAASFYALSGNVKQADYLLSAAIKNPGNLTTVQEDLRNLKTKFIIDSTNGDYLSALKDFQHFTFVNDGQTAREIEIKYESSKKEQEIKYLNQQTALQKNQLKQADTIKNITLGAIFLLIIIVALIYSQYQTNRRKNKVISRKKESLELLVKEKEWLLKEVHHRVKNNLQTVVSLLESQSAYLQDDALLAIQDSQNRVYAMSLIHQKLYQAENVASINMAAYLPELVHYLQESFNTKSINFDLQIMAVELDVSQAIPLGLIVNEAVTNSIKYAFPLNNLNKGSKQISIGLSQHNHRQVTLVVTDNGAGMPKSSHSTKTGSLGLKLVKGLTEDLAGNFSIQSGEGTQITISFTANKPLHKLHSQQDIALNGTLL